eukprot:TRINITY_DN1174_c0_g1_i2.p1 TRINITY_DN1174_c0_g1~~TRINITY_DN1174_c0_g1_i2.p1  ORF type:complete len:492 (-),score=111.54 TRINITY_DN1174_c0_g1_i2:64-1467(-)
MRAAMRAAGCVLVAAAAASEAGVQETCSAAGLSRAAFRDREAVRWLNAENARRAPYYISEAKRMYEKGLRQLKGIDKSNNDPFIAAYDGQNQVFAALDLNPHDASTWLAAGQAIAMLASLESEANDADKALRLLARACSMDKGNIDAILQWAKAKVPGEHEAFTKAKKSLGKAAKKWKTDGVPEVSVDDFLPELARRLRSESCAEGAALPALTGEQPSAVAADGSAKEQVKAALAGMTGKHIFPTLITTVNVIQYFGKDFVDKLARIAVTKYRSFSDQMKRNGQTDPNDINDRFFSAQSQKWPELYGTKEYKQLKAFLRGALIEHASKTGYKIPAEDIKETEVSMWAAVYLEDGGRHGYHVHQSSLSSCVFYAQAPAGKTPIMFIDPRGAPPTNDYEQHIGERDFEPKAPFHHNYHVFAEAGDCVCFPSWLVHRVPSHFEKTERVAFPANLQARGAWDAWARSATLA